MNGCPARIQFYLPPPSAPDHFLCRILEAHPETLLLVLHQARLSLVHPPATAAEYLETLRIQDLSRTCQVLQPFLSEL